MEGVEGETDGEIEGMEQDDESVCLFRNSTQIHICETQTINGSSLNVLSKKRLQTVIGKSKKRKDTLHTTLSALSSTEEESFKCHRARVSTYVLKYFFGKSIVYFMEKSMKLKKIENILIVGVKRMRAECRATYKDTLLQLIK